MTDKVGSNYVRVRKLDETRLVGQMRGRIR
jgi:hypothetical protein